MPLLNWSKNHFMYVLMMAQPSIPPSSNPVFVIGSQFIIPNPFEVIFVRSSSGNHLITDVNDKIMFKVRRHNKSYHDQRLILDADDIPIVTIREKVITNFLFTTCSLFIG